MQLKPGDIYGQSLNVEGKKEGETKITVELRDESDKTIFTKDVRVVVTTSPDTKKIGNGFEFDNPHAVKLTAKGITPQNARKYENSGKYLSLNDYVPQTPADTWEDVARYNLLNGEMYSKKAKVEGEINIAYKTLSWISTGIALKSGAKNIGTQYKNLDTISLGELASNRELIADFANNMANIYSKTSKTDSEVMRYIGLLTSAYSSTGLSAYTDVSNVIMSELEESKTYNTERAALRYSSAYHAMRIHEIATQKDMNEEDVKDFFYHVNAFSRLEKIEICMKYREKYATWGGKGVFSRSSLVVMTDGIGLTTKKSRLKALENLKAESENQLKGWNTYIKYLDSLEKELRGVGA